VLAIEFGEQVVGKLSARRQCDIIFDTQVFAVTKRVQNLRGFIRLAIQLDKQSVELLLLVQVLSVEREHPGLALLEFLQQCERSRPGCVTAVVFGVPGFNSRR